jgi:hypothetical protein
VVVAACLNAASRNAASRKKEVCPIFRASGPLQELVWFSAASPAVYDRRGLVAGFNLGAVKVLDLNEKVDS